jgi:hypothetical protein
MASELQAACPVEAMQAYAERPGALGRTTTNAGAVLLRTLSARNPRVLTLAAAAAKAAHGTPQHAAVLEALKNEIMQATGKASAAAAEVSSAAAGAGQAAAHSPSMRPPAVQSAAAAEQEMDLQQQQPLTQDALWAALMAKAAARTGPSGSDHSSPQLQQQKQQQPSPRPLPGHGSADSGMEAEGTSCALPWALLQAAQQAQQEEDEKEAAAAAAADASAAEAEAAAAAAASGSASAMAVDAAEASTESPKKTKSGSGSLMRGNSTVVFKRRNLSNSNALQKHFNKPVPQQPAMQPIARTMSEIPSVPKPQHTFKKQIKKKPLVMRNSSSSNLAVLQQLGRQQQQQGVSPGACAAEPECSAETGATAAAGSYMMQALGDNGPTMSNLSLRAPAVTAPAAIGTGGATDVLSFLESREKQLQMLQEQLHLQRCRMAPSSSTGTPRQAMSGLSGGVGGPCSPVYNSNTAAAISRLQRLLGGMAAAAGTNSAAAAAAAAAGMAGLQPSADAYEDVQMTDYEPASYDAVAAAALLAQARRRLAQQQQQLQYQAAQQYAQQEPAPVASAPTLSTIKALAAALVANQQQQLPAPPAAAAPGYAGSAADNADLLRKLAAALLPRG